MSKGKLIYYCVALLELILFFIFIGIYLENYFLHNVGLNQYQVHQVIPTIFISCALVAFAIGILEFVKKRYMKN